MRRNFKPGNMLYPVPAALISCKGNDGQDNLITIAWTGTINSDPPMLSISVRKERFSHHLIKESGEFVVNLTTVAMAAAVDMCGVKTGAKDDKWKLSGLTREKASVVSAPLVAESPVCLECKVKQVLELGSHDMFIAEVVAVDVDEKYFDAHDKFDLDACDFLAYSHGTYFKLGEKLGGFGFSVKKNR